MITKEEAIKKAEAYIGVIAARNRINLGLLLDETLEFEYGWVFFYQTKEYIETGDVMQMGGGNSPIIINKNDGTITKTGTGEPVRYYIEKYIEKMQGGRK